MANLLASNNLTLMDWAERIDPDGKTSTIVELLSQKNEILKDMVWVEGNLPTGHRTTVRTGLPTVTARLLNQGVTPTKSTSTQFDESCCILEAWSNVDKALADLNGNTSSFRLSEAEGFIEAMNQTMAYYLFYADTAVNPERFRGLTPRFNAISGAVNAQNIISGAGSGSVNTSVWLVGWSETTVHGIFPKASKAGLQHRDHGEQTTQVATGVAGGLLRVYQDQWIWNCGLAVRDWRYIVRICNIDTTNLVAESSAANLLKLMSRALYRLPSLSGVRPVFYMNRTTRSMLDVQGLNSGNAYYGQTQMSAQQALEQFSGGYRGVPIRVTDAILNTEATVS
jgi:hypothetical protein